MDSSRFLGPTSPPPAGRLVAVDPCQVADAGVRDQLPCQHTEGLDTAGRDFNYGIRCEMTGPHAQHRISTHTIRHALAGNGYACSAISATKKA